MFRVRLAIHSDQKQERFPLVPSEAIVLRDLAISELFRAPPAAYNHPVVDGSKPSAELHKSHTRASQHVYRTVTRLGIVVHVANAVSGID